MPRGRKRKFRIHMNVRTETLRSFLAIFLLLAFLVSLVAFVMRGYSFNEFLVQKYRLLFGNVAFLAPFLLVMTGFIFVDKLAPALKELRILFGFALGLISLTSFMHIMIPVREAYKTALQGNGGGLIGYKISSILSENLSVYGAGVVLFIALVISIFLIFNLSLEQVIEKMGFLKPVLGFMNVGFIKNIFGKKELANEEDIEITSGFSAENEEEDSSQNFKEDLEEEEAPSFEVVPSLSEPQSSEKNTRPQLGGALYSEKIDIPTLPSDKIWQNPPMDLLNDPPSEIRDTSDVDKRSKVIKDTLKSFGIEVDIMGEPKIGSSVTQYCLQPKSVTKISKIASLHDNLALALASPTGSVRIEAPIPGKSLIGIEVPNMNRSMVFLKPLLMSDSMKAMKSKLAIPLGKDVSGRTLVYDIGKMPHILIAGTTGSGKSVFIHNIILSILYRATPSEVQFILIDPKRVELSHYRDVPHLRTPVVVEMDKAASVFKWAITEMEKRYKLFDQARVSNIDAYNEKSGIQAMPYILIVVDELAEIMLNNQNEVEKSIIRLAQLARATGIHLILAVQRPSTNVITGLIKANISCRVAFNVMSQVDSRVIIDQPGAEKLLGKGDMLFIPPDASKPTRLQGAFVSYDEINKTVDFLKSEGITPEYDTEVLSMTPDKVQRGSGNSTWGEDVDDKDFDKAVDLVQTMGKASASFLQRKMSIGYNRAARLIDIMQEKGIVGPPENGSKARAVLIPGNYPTSSYPESDEEDVNF